MKQQALTSPFKKMELVFRDPPKQAHHRTGQGSVQRLLTELREHPNRWIVVGHTRKTRLAAVKSKDYYRQSFRDIEFVVADENGGWNIYARFPQS